MAPPANWLGKSHSSRANRTSVSSSTNFVRFDEGGFHQETQFDLVPELATLPSRPSREGAGHVIAGDTFCNLVPLSQLPCWTQTMLARAELVRGLEFPADMKLSQDLFYVLNTYRVANGAYIGEPLVEVRRHTRNSYRRADVKLLPDIDALTRTLPLTTSPPQRDVLRRRLGRAWPSQRGTISSVPASQGWRARPITTRSTIQTSVSTRRRVCSSRPSRRSSH